MAPARTLQSSHQEYSDPAHVCQNAYDLRVHSHEFIVHTAVWQSVLALSAYANCLIAVSMKVTRQARQRRPPPNQPPLRSGSFGCSPR